ncbi:kinesin-like protein KIF20B isoform X2 [Triplophysa rosa]|uniref:Kinesin-like protein KIF20B n=1 Tax=Triplophysa rosa TaxID=992332 RepID=A0A9W7TH54_TRIRA|nr:kinesin-like protein KIF20B isoform X2 [Triplophysa rosa]KAI7797150.1 putative kinesin-like protein KIF20B [Triplophysa rosa]
MESCLNYKPERVGSVTVEDLKKDLFAEFSKLSRESVSLKKEHLQVYLRVRPFTAAEGEEEKCISIETPDTVVLKAPRASLTARQSERLGPQLAQRFQFSQVYGPETTQRQMFDGTTKSLVKEVLEGGNSLIFTYGVTNAGKTFTFLGPESDGGILPRSLNLIFNSIEGRIYSENNIKPHRCVDFTRLTKEQQDDEATNKRNLLRRFKDSDSQKTMSSISSCSSLESSTSSDIDGDCVCLDESPHVKFSVWVSFCEIYNENIHNLLDVVPNGSHKRTTLRLAQDVKGNAFVKDLKWVQVNSADEAYRFVKIGRKNQSFSSTKLNNISSRSHSIFSIRILRIEDVCVPRIQTISELSLCDLAGSERCAKTQNRGDRLKEAGNINTSLLTLGKCINALRLNQTQSKFHQHIPFRESKLTHFLQGFFCGRGKACMIININQCASMYDETLNVLKFSAVAQKVVVLNPKPAPTIVAKRSARDVSMIINNADQKNWTRRSSLMSWEMSLEDVQEDEDDDMGEEEVESDDESMEEETVLDAADSQELQELQMKIEELKDKLSKDESEKLAMESRIREEVTAEFMELFSNMEKDYNERLQREKEIVEERADRRLEILKNLVNRTIGEINSDHSNENSAKEAEIKLLDSIIETMQDDLTKIKGDAEAVQTCLTNVPDLLETVNHLKTQLEDTTEQLGKSQHILSLKTKEFEAMCAQARESNDQLQEAKMKVRCQELMSICQEKDDMISKLQTTLDQNVEAATKDRAFIDTIKEEILHLRNNCTCMSNEDGVPREEEILTQEIQQLLQDLKMKDEQLNELKHEQSSLEKKVCDLNDRLAKQTHVNEATASSLVMERAEVTKVTNENKALANELHQLQQAAKDMSSQLKTVQMELQSQGKVANELSEELDAAKSQIKKHQEGSCGQSETIKSLMTEVDRLRQELGANQSSRGETEALRHEFEKKVEPSQKKNRRIADLEQELSQTRVQMCQLEEVCSQLECDAQVQEHKSLLSHHEAEKLNTARIRSNSELVVQLNALKQQQGMLGKQDQGTRDERWKTLVEQLVQVLSELNQNDEVLNIARAVVEQQLSKASEETEQRINEMQKELAHKNTELEKKAHELFKSRDLVNDGLNKMETMSCSLQQLEQERSDAREKLCEATAQIEQLQKQISSLSEENRLVQQRPCKVEEMRDQARHSLSRKEQSIDPLQSVQSNRSKENIQLCQSTYLDILAEQTEVMRVTFKKERAQIDQEESLEAGLNDTESITEDRAKPQDTCRNENAGDPKHHSIKELPNEQADDNQERRQEKGLQEAMGEEVRAVQTSGQLEGHQHGMLQLELEMLKQQLAEKQGAISKLQKERDDLAASFKSETQNNIRSEQASDVKSNEGDTLNPTQEVAVLDSSVLSTKSLREQRFPKPQLEISFTPLKPDRINVRKPGEEESVTIKLRRTARKRKSPEMQNAVESENRKNRRLRVNKENINSVETPTVQGKTASPLNQKDSPASLKAKKDGALQKIGDFIQGSPTLFGSKAKKIMSMVKSPEPLRPSKNNKPKRSKRKLFKTHVSSPMDIPSHPVGGCEDDKESDHLIIKRKLRTRTAK